ncbi:Nodule Cysteine-Rich (NCR) secreted peptide [Medicago truncatula]|uniref:Nodule Cysteine-Rich (NCR) secreted peptide n=1 Tax=Medicago truncatula TaxID=3880 RepID=A0A072U8A7_MEDTR|nr:Nodule Cysteine-Rich (NCR) secreted peptide [Medicago truncatula]
MFDPILVTSFYYLLFFLTAVTYCTQNYDCPDDMCPFPDISWCNKHNICACA